jgi:hypothetical protein
VQKRADAVYAKKMDTYTNSIIDMAFGNDDSKTFSFNTNSKEGMEKIEQILKEEFKTVGMDVKIKSPGQSIEIDGELFDFSDPENRVQVLNDLKQHIIDLRDDIDPQTKEPVNPGASFADDFLGNVGNSVEEWKEDFLTKRNKHYPPSTTSPVDLSPTLINEAENNTSNIMGGLNLDVVNISDLSGNAGDTESTSTTTTGTQATAGGVSSTATTTPTTPAATTWRSNENINAASVDQFNIKGSSGAGTADIFKNNKAINVEVAGGMATVKGVRADGDKLVVDVEAPFNMGGEKTMGEFSKSGNSFKFNPNKEIYSQLKGQDKKDFDAFVLAIETDPAFAMEIMKSVEGESDFNPADYK